jgi:hypothetical protein
VGRLAQKFNRILVKKHENGRETATPTEMPQARQAVNCMLMGKCTAALPGTDSGM